MSRAFAREDAFKLIFEMEITKIDSESAISYLYETVEKKNEMWAQEFISAPNRKYIEEIVKGVREKCDFLIEIITPTLKDWTISRISKVNLALLKLAVYEIYFMEDIPQKVSVNEAVKLAKTYGGKDSASFVNGVLGTVITNLDG
ncbi:MAG: transcription antitermination factor NusB [Clostridia bacterium]|nr:transcription antitermination factor NusB [Clostridia bacterium]